MSGELEPAEEDRLRGEMARTRGAALDVWGADYGHGPLSPRQREQRRRTHLPRSGDYPRPDFILVGVPKPDGRFRLIACKDIHDAQLGTEYRREMTTAEIALAARLGRTLFIDRDSYGECLAEMARIWRNWQADGRELPGG